MKQPLRLLIVDDHPIVREGLAAVVSFEPDMVVEGGAGSASEAIELIQQSKPDFVIVDISLPGKSGIELIKEIRQISPATKIIVYSMHEVRSHAQRALKAGAQGYVMKEKGASKVIEAIKMAQEGNQLVCPDEAWDEEEEESRAGVPRDAKMLPIKDLSTRQLEIFELVGSGLNSHEIGKKLSLSHKTINAHKMNIQDRLGLGSARELLMAATRWVDRR